MRLQALHRTFRARNDVLSVLAVDIPVNVRLLRRQQINSDLGPRRAKSLHALARAVSVIGGIEEAARRLGTSQTGLMLYLEDVQLVPEAVFPRIVDVLLEDELARLSKARFARRGNGGEVNPAKNNGNGKR